MLGPAQLAALTAIHRQGSFDRAAAELSVTPSAISQRLKALEDRLGTRLIRWGQPCTATEAGLRVIRHHDDIALLEQTLAGDLPGLAAPRATLRIAVNADSLATCVLPALAAVDCVLFNLVIDDKEVSQDWLKRGEVLGAITSHPGPLQGCDTMPLGFCATAPQPRPPMSRATCRKAQRQRRSPPPLPCGSTKKPTCNTFGPRGKPAAP